MIKLVLLVRRKEGISREEFRSYYESTHAVLAAQSMAKCVRYERNFVSQELSGPMDFDVITEFWFDVQGSFVEASRQLVDDQTRQVLEADEARFMDRASMRVFVADERVSDPKRLRGFGGNIGEDG